MKEMKENSISVMMYSHDGFGLGHLKRNATIAARFVKENLGSSVLMLTGHSPVPFFQLPQGVDFIKLPSIVKVNTGTWRPRTLVIGQKVLRELRSSLIKKTAQFFKPDILLVDYTPTGVWGELIPTLEMLKARKNPPAIVLGLRDILDASSVTRKLWQDEGVYDCIFKFYDKVFIFGCQEIFDTAIQYGLTGDVGQKVAYCGYLSSNGTVRSKDEVRRELNVKKEKLIVVTAGGGHDAYPMMQLSLKAFKLISKTTSVEALFITGPLMNAEHRESLEVQAANLPVRILKWTEDPLSYMNASDLIITMAGYNTLMDSIQLRKPVIVIPRKGPSAEQRTRAELFSWLGIITAVEPAESLFPSELAQAIIENLKFSFRSQISLDLNGLDTVVRHMRNLLLEKNRQRLQSRNLETTHAGK